MDIVSTASHMAMIAAFAAYGQLPMMHHVRDDGETLAMGVGDSDVLSMTDIVLGAGTVAMFYRPDRVFLMTMVEASRVDEDGVRTFPALHILEWRPGDGTGVGVLVDLETGELNDEHDLPEGEGPLAALNHMVELGMPDFDEDTVLSGLADIGWLVQAGDGSLLHLLHDDERMRDDGSSTSPD